MWGSRCRVARADAATRWSCLSCEAACLSCGCLDREARHSAGCVAVAA
jgi:hypothetical protein